MNIFISGGCKNGKSYRAQELARDMAARGSLPLYYLATMIPHDDEDLARIRRHLNEREGWGFETVEQGTDICATLDSRTVSGQPVKRGGVFLLESVTALLSNEMFRADGTVDFDAGERLAAELAQFAAQTGHTVFVSDYLYSDAFAFDDFTDHYRKALARCDRTLAKCCDRVIEVSYGFEQDWKGSSL